MYILSNDYRILNKYFPNEVIPDLIELEKNASLSMSFSHPLLVQISTISFKVPKS